MMIIYFDDSTDESFTTSNIHKLLILNTLL